MMSQERLNEIFDTSGQQWPPNLKIMTYEIEGEMWSNGKPDPETLALRKRIADLELQLADWLDGQTAVMAEICDGSDDRQHCTCVPTLRKCITDLKKENALLAAERQELISAVQTYYDSLFFSPPEKFHTMIPFNSHQESVNWDLRNCCQCDRSPLCPYEDALYDWQEGDDIPLDTAKAIGISRSGGLLQICLMIVEDLDNVSEGY
jgi:hypothetical protein